MQAVMVFISNVGCSLPRQAPLRFIGTTNHPRQCHEFSSQSSAPAFYRPCSRSKALQVKLAYALQVEWRAGLLTQPGANTVNRFSLNIDLFVSLLMHPISPAVSLSLYIYIYIYRSPPSSLSLYFPLSLSFHITLSLCLSLSACAIFN